MRPSLIASYVTQLDAISADDPEAAHSEADEILLEALPVEIGDAYDRLVKRCKWWATA